MIVLSHNRIMFLSNAYQWLVCFFSLISVPNGETIQLMLQREQELQAMPQVQRANSLPCTDRRAVLCQIQLRVVREFGLPDSTVEILQNRQYYYSKDPIPVYMERSYHHAIQRHSASPQIRFKHQYRQRSPRKTVSCISPLSSPTKSYKTLTEVGLLQTGVP